MALVAKMLVVVSVVLVRVEVFTTMVEVVAVGIRHSRTNSNKGNSGI